MKAKGTPHVVIAGGGPSGMMAAIAASSRGAHVTLIEQNSSCGKKLLLAGGGRCNFTNACDKGELPAHYIHGGKFLRDAFKLFSPDDLISSFKKHHVSSHREADGRVFPQSNDAADILGTLIEELRAQKVTVLYRQRVKNIIVKGNSVKGIKTVNGNTLECDRLVLATGGISYPHTGSDGGGLRLAAKIGHTVTPLSAGLAGIILTYPYLKKLQGLSLSGVTLTFSLGKKKIKTTQGDILFTEEGLSGPLVISSSSRITHFLREKQPVTVSVDFLPAVPKETLTRQLNEQWRTHGRRAIKNTIEFLPLRLIQTLLAAHKIDLEKTTAHITKSERNIICGMLKEMPWKITSLEPVENAMITSGGVSLKEIDPRSMASRLVKGLYFAGEMLDIDGDTGGFNLQAAFSTGYCAGIHAARQATQI